MVRGCRETRHAAAPHSFIPHPHLIVQPPSLPQQRHVPAVQHDVVGGQGDCVGGWRGGSAGHGASAGERARVFFACGAALEWVDAPTRGAKQRVARCVSLVCASERKCYCRHTRTAHLFLPLRLFSHTPSTTRTRYSTLTTHTRHGPRGRRRFAGVAGRRASAAAAWLPTAPMCLPSHRHRLLVGPHNYPCQFTHHCNVRLGQ